MSIADDLNASAEMLGASGSPVTVSTENRPLHRIAEIRSQQGVSLRCAARRMGASLEQVRRQEEASCDMSLSDLYRWQRTLDVPIADLLVDIDAPLSEPVLTRARMLRVMKTVRAIAESATAASQRRMAEMLEGQLVEIMPELSGVSAWHSVGQRRTADELGRIAENPLADDFFVNGDS